LPEKDIQSLTQSWVKQGAPEFEASAMKMLDGSGGGFDFDGPEESAESGDGDGYDAMYDEILAWVASQKDVSASLLQRKYRLGYPRAARMIEVFEKEGVVGPANGSKPRQVMINKL
jgi:S-DNA-T family DNA segregation ATPase FtsK/SpoIIIE